MQEKEFEKKVQEQMQDFGLQPSDEVWKEVEHRIRKEKKRRFILWWPLLLLLLAGGAGAYYLLNEKNKNNHSVAAVATEQAPTKKDNTLTGTDKSLPQTTVMPTGESTVDETNTDIKKIGAPVSTQESKSTPGQITTTAIQIQKGNGLVAKKKQKQAVKVVSPPENKYSMVDKDAEKEKPSTTNDVETPVANIKILDQPAVASFDSAATKSVSEKKKDKTDSIVTVATTIQNKKEKKKSVWATGISFYAGSSAVADGLAVLRTGAMEDANSQLAVNPGTAAAVQSPVSSGLSFGTGVFIQKPLSKKTTIRFGLSYNYLSTRMAVGNRVDSFIYVNGAGGGSNQGTSAGNYYRASSANKYTNRYHLAALSADLSWRIIDGKKIKVNWENGVSFSRLFSSNMLHYSSSIPGYYPDNSLLAKNQLIISTGLSIPVAGKFSLQPFLSHSLTPVLRKNSNTGKYYTVFGLKANFLFGK